MKAGNPVFDQVVLKAKQANQWFTEENIRLAVTNICDAFLEEEKLEAWLSAYPEKEDFSQKTVGLVMAGNIPLVGFHDFLAILASGHKVMMRYSDKDKVLFPYILKELNEIDSRISDHVAVVDRLTGFDAVIATGSNNSARYFDYYFGKYPNIIRKNRTSVAILSGNEDETAFAGLGKDIFRYFGLGCRNVSKVYVPQEYDFIPMLEKLQTHQDLILHNKYKNNYDYNLTLLILNKIPYLSNSCLLLHEDVSLHSRIASLHYEYYDAKRDLERDLLEQKNEIQCVVAGEPLKHFDVVPFGETQQPKLNDYADGVDSMAFLNKL